MTARVKLQSLEIQNFLGAGTPPVTLQFNSEHAVLCGPNGGGKTTVLSALDCLRRSLSAVSSHTGLPFLRGLGGAVVGGRHQAQVWEWADARPQLTAETFHGDAEVFRVVAEAAVPLLLFPPELRSSALFFDPRYPHECRFTIQDDPVRLGFEIQARRDQKTRLESVRLGEHEIFRNKESTPYFALTRGETQGWINYLTPGGEQACAEIFSMPLSVLQRTIFFPSYRRASLGPDSDLGLLAGGAGLVSWIETASNPDPRDNESQRRHRLLQEFQEEFAEFAGFRNVSLSVRKHSPPLRSDEQIEINVTIDGRLRLLSQLGAGIGEALIVLLVSKLSQEWRIPPVDIVLLEEPELHIHPSLQRRLLERLAKYGVQIIAATHSPTVVNWFVRSGSRVFRTQFDEAEKRTTAQQVSGLTELRGLMESIGASPADAVLADKVLLVEGSNDVPVFEAWLRKAPSHAGQNVAVLALGGSGAASRNFDPGQWRSLHPKIRAIVDSERKSAEQEPQEERQKIKSKLDAAGIPCHLTEKRSTENYFSQRALRLVYRDCPDILDPLDPFGDPCLAKQGVKQFTKWRNGEVARAMEWAEIETTDLGKQIEDFLKF